MKFIDFISTLTDESMNVTITDLETDTELAEIKAGGVKNLDDSIENREVKRWKVVGSGHIIVVLGDEIIDPDPATP